MPRAKTNKLYRTFVKGLITEASPLTYPENASIGELNTIVSRKGNRTRRQGIRYEENFVMNNIAEATANVAINEFTWHSVAKQQGKVVTAIQVGPVIHFWEVDQAPLSDNKLSFTVDLAQFKSPSANSAEIKLQAASFSSGAGYLFIAHPLCDPIVVEYLKETGTYNAVRVIIQIRDFDGVYDGLSNDEEPSTLSNEHRYNLKNQGWLSPSEFVTPAAADASTGLQGDNSGTAQDVGVYYDPYAGTPREVGTN